MEFCPQEGKVLAAARSGQLPDDLAAHALQCHSCAENLLVASFLAEEPEAMDLPPPGLVYWKAELRARREQAERAMRPVRTMEITAMFLLCLGVVLLGTISGSLVLPLAALGFVLAMTGIGWIVKRFLSQDAYSNSTRSIARNS